MGQPGSMTFRERLRKERKKTGLSLAKFSRLVGVCSNFIGEIERGKSKLPKERVRDFERALEVERGGLMIAYLTQQIEDLEEQKENVRQEIEREKRIQSLKRVNQVVRNEQEKQG